MIFIAILVVASFNNKKSSQNKILIYAVSMCIIMCFSLFVPRSAIYVKSEEVNHEASQGYNELLSEIPKDAQITADGYYIPHMYNFKNLYQYPNFYSDNIKSEYLLVNIDNVNQNQDGLADFMGNDYEFLKQSENMCLYRLKN